MGLILSIETSTDICSVALSQEGKTVAEKTITQGQSHASSLTVIIEELFKGEGKPNMKMLDAVAVSCGPGSYTGLRIGVSTAKGICYGLNIPLISIGSLQVLAAAVENRDNQNIRIAPMIDARRMEVYTAIFNGQLELETPVEAMVVDEFSFIEQLNLGEIVFVGNGAEKCQTVITHPNARFINNLHPLATKMGQLAYEAFLRERFEDVAYFEPYYLKDFVAIAAKNKVL